VKEGQGSSFLQSFTTGERSKSTGQSTDETAGDSDETAKGSTFDSNFAAADESESDAEGSISSSSSDPGLDSTEETAEEIDESGMSSGPETEPQVYAHQGTPTTVAAVVPGCTRMLNEKYDYSKEDMVERRPKLNVSWSDCCEACRGNRECFAITYNSSNGQCVLLRAGDYSIEYKKEFSSWRSY